MSSKMVLYFFQGEHGESEQTPNAFTLNATAKPISLGELLRSFPAQEQGPFAFRFRVADKQCGYVWQDISDPSELLPEYDGVISAKILRLSALNQRPLHSRLRRKLPDAFKQKPFVPPQESQRTPAPQSQPSTSPRTPQAKLEQQPASTKASPSPSRTPARATSQTPPPADTFESFLSGSSSDGVPKPVVTEDFLTFSQPVPTRAAPSNGFPQSNGINHDSPDIDTDDSSRARSNGATTQVQGGGALDLWHEVQERNNKITEEMDEARQTIGPRLTHWAEDNGKKRNVRTLLSTMHDVLWEGARWKALSLVDVLDPSQVKLAYRRAMLVVHPDRNTNLSGTNMFIAKRIFEAINEAYSIFLEHEQP